VAYTRQEFGCEEETNHFSGIHPCFHKINPLLIIHTFHRRSLPNRMQRKRIKVFLLQSVSLLANSGLHHLKTTFFNCWITYVGFKVCLFRSKNMYKKYYIYISNGLINWQVCYCLLQVLGLQLCSKQLLQQATSYLWHFFGTYQHHQRWRPQTPIWGGSISWTTNKSASAQNIAAAFYLGVYQGVIYISAGKAAIEST